MAQSLSKPDHLRLLRPAVTVLLMLGLAGFILTLLLSFEEPNRLLLYLSSGLLLAPVLVVFAHVWLTGALTPEQRRLWFRHLTGQQAPSAFGEYLTCTHPGVAARRLAENRSDTNQLE